jgi:hypothetical protein
VETTNPEPFWALDRYFDDGSRIGIDHNIGPRDAVVKAGNRLSTFVSSTLAARGFRSFEDDRSVQELFDAVRDVRKGVAD